MKFLGVLPFCYEPYFDACIATMAPEFSKHCVFIDDTDPVGGIGIMRAYNRGIDLMNERGADWLLIMSAAVRFGKLGGTDIIQTLEDHPDHYVIHIASDNVKGGKQQDGSGGHNKIFGWHLSAFHRTLFDNIGRWDENFSPYSLDDIDMSIRIQHFYRGAPGWDAIPCDVTDTTMSHSINLAGLKADYPPRGAYFKRKWNREGGEWDKLTYKHPFGNPDNPLSYWPEPGDPLSIWENEFKNPEFEGMT